MSSFGLAIANYPDPTSGIPVQSAYGYCSFLAVDEQSQTARMVISVYRSKSAADAIDPPCIPLGIHEIQLWPDDDGGTRLSYPAFKAQHMTEFGMLAGAIQTLALSQIPNASPYQS